VDVGVLSAGWFKQKLTEGGKIFVPWIDVHDQRGQHWLLNQLGLWILVREYLHATLLLGRARTVRQDRWFGPDLVSVDINFDGFRREKDDQTPLFHDRHVDMILADCQTAFRELTQVREETVRSTRRLREMQQAASSETMGNIDRSVRRGEIGAEGARVVRDLSAGVLVVGATFLSGGTALAVLGGGSALKGTGTYQDTGNVGAAMLDATATFTVGAIGIGAAAASTTNAASAVARPGLMARAGQATTGGMRQAITDHARQQGAIVLVGAGLNAQFELANGLVQGRTMEESVRSAGTRFGTDVASGLVLGPVLDRCALPIAVRLVTDTAANRAADALVTPGNNMAQQVARAPARARNLMDAGATGNDAGEFIREHVLVRA
jgi:hypothetical protein